MSVAELPPPPSDAPEPTEDRLPPQDIPAERSVLGAMLLSKDAIADVVEELRVEDFYRPDHQTIFSTILDLFTKGQPADMVTVADALTRSGDLNRVGGAPYLHTLSAEVPTAANATYYAQIVHGKAVLRNLVNAGTRIAQWGYSGEGEVEQIADRAQAEVFEATVTRAANDYRPLGEVMPDAIAEIEGIASRGGEMVGVPTGFVDLDRLTNGLHPGQLIIVAARPAIGKALAVDTPVPTPQGWTTMGEISVGDQVLAPDGTATKVVAATEVMVGRPCYLVEFSDGSRIVADAQHQWQVETTEGSQAVTTEVLHEQQGGGHGPFLLPMVESLDLSEAVLPIDPYALGAWLSHTTGELPDEVQMMAAAAGGDLTEVAARARDLGISHRGFIPPQYLRASQQQRRDLLAGLLDAGAELNDDGRIVLDTESRPLAQGLFELLSTFGMSATVSGRPHHGSTGPQVRLTFTSDQSVFRVTEKDLRHKEWLAHNTVSHERSIANITAIPSVPVRCIEVDHSAHLFLAGRTMVPTHNSTLGLDIARSASIKNGLASVIFSLEMSSQEIVTRLLSAEAQIPLHHIRSGNVQDSDWSKIASRQGVLHGSPLYIDDSPNMTMAEIRAKCRRLRQRNELRLVIVDYMQLMTSGKRVESRQQEVSEFSRALKLLAKELDVPVIAISQLNRGPEARNDKKPMLSDLRESGCLPARTKIIRADTGAEVTLGELHASGARNVPVWSLDDSLRHRARTMTHVFPTGHREVFEVVLSSGRRLHATANHKLLTYGGWLPLNDLTPGDRIAVPRHVPAPLDDLTWDEDELVLLAHLLGDGSFVKRQPIRYASVSEENLTAVAEAAKRRFGISAVRDEYAAARVTSLRLPAPFRLARGRRNPIAAWLDGLGLFGARSHEKFVPSEIAGLRKDQVALFLRHLWATDGSITVDRKGHAHIYYATTSSALADGVARLLLRFGLVARIYQAHKPGYRPSYHVTVSGVADQKVFLRRVGGFGPKAAAASEALARLEGVVANTNVDTVPRAVWDDVRSLLADSRISHREFQDRLGTNYCGSTLFKAAPSRERLGRVAGVLANAELEMMATNDVHWDEIVSIKSLGHEDVFDATVLGTHNFVADGVTVHNSLEQDADMVVLIHREDAYDRDSPRIGEADLIVAKHRNGPTDTVTVAFQGHYSRFVDMARE